MKKYFGSPTRVWVNCPSFLSCYNHLHGRVGIALTIGDRDGKCNTTLYFNSGSIRSILIDPIYLESKNSQEDILMLNKEYPKTMKKIIKTHGFNITIDVPDGFEIDHEKSSFSKIVFKKKKEDKLPSSWSDLQYLKNGYFIDSGSEVCEMDENSPTCYENRNLFQSKNKANAAIALAQLSQLREVYRAGWNPDWSEIKQNKYCVTCINNYKSVCIRINENYFLSFQKEETAELFLKNFKELIEEASPLLFG